MPRDFRRLVVIPVYSRDVERAASVLEAVDRLSTVKGESLVVWNDSAARCPAEFIGNGRRRIEFDRELGWLGISHGIGQAFQLALDEKFDAVVKLDADTAIVRRGWDAALLAGMEGAVQRGQIIEHCLTNWIERPAGEIPGAFADELLQAMRYSPALRWVRPLIGSGRWHEDHVQGGCYAFSCAALERISRFVGLIPGQEESGVGEDFLFTLRARAAGVRQECWPAIFSAWTDKGAGVHLTSARQIRDYRGAHVIHPVKDLAAMRLLHEEAR
jgi:hypothetical protein